MIRATSFLASAQKTPPYSMSMNNVTRKNRMSAETLAARTGLPSETCIAIASASSLREFYLDSDSGCAASVPYSCGEDCCGIEYLYVRGPLGEVHEREVDGIE